MKEAPGGRSPTENIKTVQKRRTFKMDKPKRAATTTMSENKKVKITDNLQDNMTHNTYMQTSHQTTHTNTQRQPTMLEINAIIHTPMDTLDTNTTHNMRNITQQMQAM